MNFIKFDIFASEFGMNKVTQLLEMKGNTATEIEKETAESIIGKYVVRMKDDEYVGSAYYADDEEGRKTVADLKVLFMMLKSKELYGDYGWDVTTGRMYAQDSIVDETNWNEL